LTRLNPFAPDPKRAYLRRKHTSTKKAHFTEGWVEFTDKQIARSVASILNAQPIGGKKGTRWRDDVWTMKYLPRFKWNMLTEQVGKSARNHAFSPFIIEALIFLILRGQLMKSRHILPDFGWSYLNPNRNSEIILNRSSLHASWRRGVRERDSGKVK
jgi:hypothetical protein